MKPKLTLYSRRDCCLCTDMKMVIQQVAGRIAVEVEEIDIDNSDELRGKLSDQIPLLCIDGRKAFKYRVTTEELKRRLEQQAHRAHRRWFGR